MTSALVVVALVLGACSGSGDSSGTTPPTTSPPPSTTAAVTTTPEAPTTTTTTTTAAPTLSYETAIPVGANGIAYRGGAEDLEIVGPSVVAAAGGTIYIGDPVADVLWIASGSDFRSIDLVALDILNIEAMTATDDRLYIIEVFFAPTRQRLHTFSLDGELESSTDLAEGARLENGLSGILVDDGGGPTVLLAGGALYANPTDGQTSESIALGGHTVAQTGSDITLDGRLITAGLNGRLGGLRILGGTEEITVLIREEVLSTDPVIEVMASVEWYANGQLVGSALLPLDQQSISAPPAITLTPDGQVVVLLAQDDAVRSVVLHPEPGRIVGNTTA